MKLRQLIKIRLGMCLPRREMAARAGVSVNQIHKLETGAVRWKSMQYRVRLGIAAAYGLDPLTGELLGGVDVQKEAAAEPSAA